MIVNYHGDFLTELFFMVSNKQLSKAVLSAPSALLTRALLGANNCVVVNSPSMKRLIRERGYLPESKIPVIPNGIDSWWFGDQRASSKGTDGKSILFHGRIAKQKGVLQLVYAFAKLKSAGLVDRLVLVGEGPLRSRVFKLATRLGCQSSVMITGWIPREEVRYRLRNATVCVYPSLYEPFSLTALEAIAASTRPVCISAETGVLDYLEGEKGIIVMRPGVVEIANSIETALSIKDGFRPEGEQAALMRRFGWDAIAARYISLYETQLGN